MRIKLLRVGISIVLFDKINRLKLTN
jgi:hypothetical protein